MIDKSCASCLGRRGSLVQIQSPRPRTDLTEDLKKIDVSTLILHEDDDQIVPIADSVIKDAKLVVYKGGSQRGLFRSSARTCLPSSRDDLGLLFEQGKSRIYPCYESRSIPWLPGSEGSVGNAVHHRHHGGSASSLRAVDRTRSSPILRESVGLTSRRVWRPPPHRKRFASRPSFAAVGRQRATPPRFVRLEVGINNREQRSVAASEEVADDVVRLDGRAGLNVSKHRSR